MRRAAYIAIALAVGYFVGCAATAMELARIPLDDYRAFRREMRLAMNMEEDVGGEGG